MNEVYNPENDALPLDYSFKKLQSLANVESEKPRDTRLGKNPILSTKKRYLTRAVWLNNNNITSIEGLDRFLDAVLQNPMCLSWIDFSFNNIKELDPVILNFCNLTIMYLHGNSIEEFEPIVKLKELKKLRKFTLHGNPVSFNAGYRICVLKFLPQIVNLDFSPVVSQEKFYPLPPGAFKKYATLMNA